jgi:bifunctional oligoribonuclease and PAP phosphatase NrnA
VGAKVIESCLLTIELLNVAPGTKLGHWTLFVQLCSRFMKPIKDLYPLLTGGRTVAITMHQKPDADAMGSALALYHFLQSLGYTVQVISPTNWARWLDWMPGCNVVVDYELQKDKAHEILDQTEWLFCLDFNCLARTKNLAPLLEKKHLTRILIDHHQQPELESFTWGISDTTKSSTCEMVYDFIVEAGFKDHVTLEMAQCLYAGVMADTGSFRFPSASGRVHTMVAHLKELGLKHTKVHENIYDNFLENRLRFIGHILQNRMEVYYEYNTALIYVPKKDLLRFEIKTGDTDMLVNYPLSIQGIKLAAMVIDRDEERKWSFRSKDDFDVNTFARLHFEGGGHFNAAGGRSSASLDATVQHFIEAMKKNALQLQ